MGYAFFSPDFVRVAEENPGSPVYVQRAVHALFVLYSMVASGGLLPLLVKELIPFVHEFYNDYIHQALVNILHNVRLAREYERRRIAYVQKYLFRQGFLENQPADVDLVRVLENENQGGNPAEMIPLEYQYVNRRYPDRPPVDARKLNEHQLQNYIPRAVYDALNPQAIENTQQRTRDTLQRTGDTLQRTRDTLQRVQNMQASIAKASIAKASPQPEGSLGGVPPLLPSKPKYAPVMPSKSKHPPVLPQTPKYPPVLPSTPKYPPSHQTGARPKAPQGQFLPGVSKEAKFMRPMTDEELQRTRDIYAARHPQASSSSSGSGRFPSARPIVKTSERKQMLPYLDINNDYQTFH